MAGQVDHGEQEVTDFGLRRPAITVRYLGFDLVCFLSDLGKDCQRVVPIEAHPSGLDLQLECTGKGREANRNAGERAFLASITLPPGPLLPLLPLDALPQALDRARRQTPCLAEHVRMASQELLGQGLYDVGEGERALLLRHAGVEYHLQ